MQAISVWVKNIILLILVTTFLIMFLPEGNMKKYLRVIMGFFIISVFISPVADIFQKDIYIKNLVPEDILQNKWQNINSRGESLQDTNTEIVKKRYQESISRQVSNIVDLGYPEYDQEIKVEVEENSYDINEIKITLIDKSIDEIQIGPIEIKDTDENAQPEKSTSLKKINKMKNNVKNKICSGLQIPEDMVTVEILKTR